MDGDCQYKKGQLRFWGGSVQPVCPRCRQLSCCDSLFTCIPDTDFETMLVNRQCMLHRCHQHSVAECTLEQWPPACLEAVWSDLGISASTIKGGLEMSKGELFIARRCA